MSQKTNQKVLGIDLGTTNSAARSHRRQQRLDPIRRRLEQARRPARQSQTAARIPPGHVAQWRRYSRARRLDDGDAHCQRNRTHGTDRRLVD